MLYGLLGKRLSHSFSRRYFSDKFAAEGIPARYENFELPSLDQLPLLLAQEPDLRGFNVTIPYKVEILPLLHSLSDEAAAVGAVNVVKVEGGRLHGHNTDVHGFRESLAAFYQEGPGGKALVLGTGGASRAVTFVLEHFFEFEEITRVSRNPAAGQLSYGQLQDISAYRIIVNTTPVGQFPLATEKPEMPYNTLRPGQHLYDLIYNPDPTAFLQEGKVRGCRTQGGLEMLILQAERAWEIWQG